MKKLLYLVHRLPYPPNKGDKIPSFNMLRYLSRFFDVYLGTFIDDPNDWQYVEKVSAFCTDSCIVKINPSVARLKSLSGLLTGEPLSLPYYESEKMQNWVNQVLQDVRPDAVLMYSGVTAQFVSGKIAPGTTTLLDLVDVDSDKWQQYSQRHAWPMNWIYRRESRKLLTYEKGMAAEFDATMLVSENEARLFKELAPESAEKIHWRTQGVDYGYFDPVIDFDNPYDPKAKVIVFTGVMDYWQNIDAVCWFANEVYPKIKSDVPEARFVIVGRNPDARVRRLADTKGVTVTGAVLDVRPYLKHAHVAVAPLRVARGVQNKILEAMAMAKPVVATTPAFSGIDFHGFVPRVADDVETFAKICIDLLAKDDVGSGGGGGGGGGARVVPPIVGLGSTILERGVVEAAGRLKHRGADINNLPYESIIESGVGRLKHRGADIKARQLIVEHFSWNNSLEEIKNLLS